MQRCGVVIPQAPARPVLFLLFTGLARTHLVKHPLIVDRACSRSARDEWPRVRPVGRARQVPLECHSLVCVDAAGESRLSLATTLRFDCRPAKLRLQADAAGSHRIVFGSALLLGDATRTSVAIWSRPTHVTDAYARKSLDCPCADRGSFLWLRRFQHYTRAIARTSRGKSSSMVTRRWVTPWSWA
jgi:hypothetical protein